MFENYRFTPEEAAAGLAELLVAVRERGQDPLPLFVSSFAKRLAADRRRYRDYGPYWWALKDVMNRNGHALGDQSDPLVMVQYAGQDDLQTLWMANEFRERYFIGGTMAVYNERFALGVDGEPDYVLWDPDLEGPP